MRRREKLRFKFVSLICTLVILVISAIPLYDRGTDARLLGVIFGAMGSGGLLSDIVRDFRRRKGRED